jgi:hypothetical protein
MDERLIQYLNGVFAPYEGVKSAAELKADLLADLQERFRELKAEGKDDETAFAMTIDSIGDIEQTVQEVAKASLNEASFKGATFKSVAFPSANSMFKRYYRAIKTICFDGARMDKLTYAALKGMEANLSKVTII